MTLHCLQATAVETLCYVGLIVIERVHLVLLPLLVNNERKVVHFPRGSQETLHFLMQTRFKKEGLHRRLVGNCTGRMESPSAVVHQLHGNNLPTLHSPLSLCALL